MLFRSGLPALARAVSDCLGRGFRDIDVETDAGNGRLLAWLAAHGEVLSRQFTDDRVTVHCRIPAALLGRIDPAEADVAPHVAASERFPAPGSPASAASAESSGAAATPPAP